MSVHLNTVIFNYRFTKVLGEGGFGVVYLAEHEQLGRRAAAKVLHPEYARRPQVVERFFREARAVCEIGHPAIIEITNYGHLDSGEPFYLMEFVEGKALSDLAKERGGLSLQDIATIFEPVADALFAAHEARIIHRDLKPDNVMVVERNGEIVDVKLLDFGIAKLLGDADHVQSMTGAAMGTPNYMAPEQATDAKNVDARADVYGMAATIYSALTARPPFAGSSTTEILVALATKPAPRLRDSRQDIPPQVDEIIARCLAKHPDERPSSILEAWQLISSAIGLAPSAGASSSRLRMASHPGFAQAAAGKPETTLGASAAEIAASASASMPRMTQVQGPPPKKSNKGLMAAALVAVAGMATAGVLIATGGDKKSDDTGTSASAAADTNQSDTDTRDSTKPESSKPGAGTSAATTATTATTAGSDPKPAVTIDAGPAISCSWRGFTKVRDEPPDLEGLLEAMMRLDQCHQANKIDAKNHAQMAAAYEKLIDKAKKAQSKAAAKCTKTLDRLKRSSSKSKLRRGLKQLAACKEHLDEAQHAAFKSAFDRRLAKLRGAGSSTSEVAKPSCAGGRLVKRGRSWSCSCPSGTSYKLGRCERKPLVCTGGRYASGSRCVCPSGTNWDGRACKRPAPSCSYSSFASLCRQSRPSKSVIRNALRKLRQCRSALGDARYRGLHSCLYSKSL